MSANLGLLLTLAIGFGWMAGFASGWNRGRAKQVRS